MSDTSQQKIQVGLRNIKLHMADQKNRTRRTANNFFWIFMLVGMCLFIVQFAFELKISNTVWNIILVGLAYCEFVNQRNKGWLEGFKYSNWNGDCPDEIEPDEEH